MVRLSAADCILKFDKKNKEALEQLIKLLLDK